MSNIFISYAREDIDIADRLYQDLTALNAQPWMDKYSLNPGHGWRGVIKNAIRHSSHFVVLISKNSIKKRGYAQLEVVEDQLCEGNSAGRNLYHPRKVR
jgi:hypothetical protein